MINLLATPVVVAIAMVHRVTQAVAPTNLLVRRVRSAHSRWRLAAVLLGLAAVLFLVMHVVANAVSAGAPGWLNLLVLVLAWDAIKVGWLAVGVILRGAVGSVCQTVGRASQVPQPTS